MTKKIYMIGIGGMGMAPLAIYLQQSGQYELYGTDDKLSPTVKQLLLSCGVLIAKELPDDIEHVVYSSAISAEHKIREQAKAQGIPQSARGHFLAELAKEFKVIAVVGSHGKTSTTALLIHAIKHLGINCSYILGAFFKDNQYLPAQCVEGSDYLLLEVDESDGTIDAFSPEITLAVNYDWDHASSYPSPEDFQNTLKALFERSSNVLYPADCEVLKGLLDGLSSVGFSPNYEDFTQYNRSAALSVLKELGHNASDDVFENFPGVARRTEILYQEADFKVLADYAHHPTEIAAYMDWFKASGKTIVIYQPHRYSRTQSHLKEFAETFTHIQCDELILLPVYAASEEPIPGIDSDAIYNALSPQAQSRTCVLPFDYEQLRNHLPSADQPANVVFLGAGDIWELANAYAKERREQAFFKKLTCALGDSSASKFTQNEDISKKTTLRVGGQARFYLEPDSVETLQTAVKLALETQIPFYLMGRGSNLIVKDSGYAGLVIRLHGEFWSQIEGQDNQNVRAYAGVRLKELCGYACKAGLTGFEFLEGIPGAVGGSLRMNAGAMGGWIFDIIESIGCLDPKTGEVHTFDKEELTVGYRHCLQLKDAIALWADFKPTGQETPEAIRERMDSFASERKGSQPRQPSAGCIFKNPENNHAGKLIDELGLKGYAQGNAQISEIHGNFIVNHGDASSEDVLEIVRHARAVIHEKTGILLEPEALLLGNDWEQELNA